ncbi:alpha/beta-hydrolase [Penicillium sp. IBT 16267x]|nr:alpha/beta-hydrolase [Penicillium sp. IBT 16267x]
MSAEKPTIVLIPGAWHAGSTYEPVAALLRAQGYPAETLTLLSAGGPPSTSVAEDAEHIRKTLEPLIEQGKEVVLALHSYSGVPGSECVKGLTRKELEAQGKKGGIVAMVFVAAFLLPAGQSIDSFLPGGAGGIVKIEDDNKCYMLNPAERFYNDLDEETTNKHLAKLMHQAWPTFKDPLTHEGYRDVPSTYLLCEKDGAIPFEAQKFMASYPGEGVLKVHTCAAGHSPMLSMPQVVADVIHGAASAVTVAA